MAGDSSLGTLGVNIAAYAGQFMAELTRAENGMTKFQRGISKTLTKAGLDTIGLGNAARAMSNELQYVWNNIEKIPGIDPLTIASVQEMKGAVEEFQQSIHRLVAGGMSLFAQFGKSLGLVAGAITTAFHNTSLTDLFTNPTMMAANFAVALTDVDAALRADFDAATKGAHAQNELAAATARTTAAKSAAAELLASVSKANAAFARSEAAKLESMKSEGEAIRRELLTPQEEWIEQLFRLNELLNANAISQDTFNRAMKQADIKLAVANTKPVVEQLTQAKDISADTTKRIGEAWDRLGTEMSDTIGRSLVGMEGGFSNFGDSVKRIFQEMLAEIIKVELEALILKPIIDKIKIGSGGSGSLGLGILKGVGAIFGFAEGGEPPVGRPSLVGEQGPELFVPHTAGTIVPNHALQGGGSGRGDVKNFYIDARGADRTGLARLESMIRAVNGSIEHRALGTVMDHRRRGAFA